MGKLPKFAADMFHLEGTDLWLTTTAEMELTNLYRDETIDADAIADQGLRRGRPASALKPALRARTRAE